MTKFLIKKFIRDSDNIRSTNVREAYGKLAGIVGLVTNTFISAFKIGIGLMVNSIAVIADGVNSLADASSSVIALVGFKMAAKKGDREHPYGHARYEYITGMIVSVIIIIVGFQLMTTSIDKIINPEELEFNWLVIVILVVSMGIKIWQAFFNIYLGKKIKSVTLKATGTDSRNDVIATGAVLLSILFSHFNEFNIDGYMGTAVALFIIYSGIVLIKETSSPLLGQAPDPALVKDIEDSVLEYSGVLDVHDLEVHDYGPGNVFATIHIEVDANQDVLKCHDLIDNIEYQVGEKLNIDLVGHMDPVDTKDPIIKELNKVIKKLIEPLSYVTDYHDLRIVKGDTHTNVIFDLVLPVDCDIHKSELRKYLQTEITKLYPNFNLVIKYDLDYTVREG